MAADGMSFSAAQQEYLKGMMAGIEARRAVFGLPLAPAGGAAAADPDDLQRIAQDRTVAAGGKLVPEEEAKRKKHPLRPFDEGFKGFKIRIPPSQLGVSMLSRLPLQRSKTGLAFRPARDQAERSTSRTECLSRVRTCGAGSRKARIFMCAGTRPEWRATLTPLSAGWPSRKAG